MVTTKLTIDLIEVMQNDVIRVHVKTSVLSDDVEIAAYQAAQIPA